ncbi:MAG: hypothetical protein ABI945_09440 [Nitrospirales bacterium]
MRLRMLRQYGLLCQLSVIAVVTGLLFNVQTTVLADTSAEDLQLVPSEDYAIYDRIIQAKFLTSDTTLVLIRRLTATRIGPEEVPFRRQFFEENQFFDGTLPPSLLAEFLTGTRRPSRLQSKLNFGVRYRLVSNFNAEIEEAGLVLHSAAWTAAGADPRIGLEFSRVAYAPKENLALVYVGNYRSDGTGAGFFIVLQPQHPDGKSRTRKSYG